MSFLDNISLLNKLDTKNQRANPNEMKFLTVNHKIRKKKTIYISSYFINKKLKFALATKYELKYNSCHLSLLYET